MSVLQPLKRLRSGASDDDDDDWNPSSRRRLSPQHRPTTERQQHFPHPSFSSAYFASAGMGGTHRAAPTLPRITHFSLPTSPPLSHSPLIQLPPPYRPAFVAAPPPPSIFTLPAYPAPNAVSPLAGQASPVTLPPLASRAASTEIILVDDNDTDIDLDMARAIEASMVDATQSAAVSLAVFSVPPATPPSPSNSVICVDVDMDDDECQMYEPSSSSSASSSVAYLPLPPSRWGWLPVDLLALISTFQFGGRRSAAGQQYAEYNNSMYVQPHVQYHARPGKVVPRPLHGAIAVASRPVQQQPHRGEMLEPADDSLLSIQLLLRMSTVCRHWHGAIRPRMHHFQRSFKYGCRVVDCWSGVQQLEMKQSGKHVFVGGLRVSGSHIGIVLTSMTRLRSLCLEFNVDQSVAEESDFDMLLLGSTVANFYPELQQLTVRLVHNHVHGQHKHHRKRKSRSHHLQQQTPQQSLYSSLSSWLDCHPKLRSFTLIDPHSTLPMPFIPQPMAVAVNPLAPNQFLPNGPFPPGLFPAGVYPPGHPLNAAPVNHFPAAAQPAYRHPLIPQPSAGALRLLCTGRLQHLALGGETMVRLAWGEADERYSSASRPCFQSDDVRSIALLGDWQQQRYIDALNEALPSLTHITLSRLQSPRGVDQILATLGHRITFLRGGLSALSLPDTCIRCTALQSLYIHAHHAPAELAVVYAALPSLPSLTQLSVVEQQQSGGGRYPVMHDLPVLSLPPLPELQYLHLQLSSFRVFPHSANRKPSAILPATLTHLLLSVPGQQLVPHLSSVPQLFPRLTHCHINSGASVTSQTWETRLGRLKSRLRTVWCDSEAEVARHRLDVAWQAEVGVEVSSAEEWETES